MDYGGNKRKKPLSPQSNSKRKPRKTTYFFNPKNQLTNDKVIDNSNEISGDKSVQDITKIVSPVRKVNDKTNDIEFNTSINQSSDDSFEGIGIKWKKSPRNPRLTPKKPSQMLSSSPLKNLVEREEDSPALINEQAELMLEKYGSGFHNILSQTPRPKKTISDLTGGKIRNPPTLQRAKSLGSNPKPNKLKNWLDKLDFNLLEKEKVSENPKSDDRKSSHDRVHSVPDMNNFLETAKLMDSKADSSDPFSDDEEFIASFAPVKIPSSPTKVLNKTIIEQPGIKFEQSNEIDEFEEFDLSNDLSHVQLKTKYTNDIEELENVEDTFIVPNSTKLSYSRPDLKRFQIVSILSTSYKIKDNKRTQLIMTVKNNQDIESKLVIRGEYTTLNFAKDDIVNVIITDEQNPHLIDDERNILIWNPDILVSATTVSQQLTCPRKSVLTDRFKFPGETTLPIMLGYVLHEIFQSCFMVGDWSLDRMTAKAEELIEDYKLSFYSLGQGKDQEALQQVKETLPYLPEWFNKYYQKPARNSIPVIGTREEVSFAINKALDIEENIWSPIFGVKGKVDVTVEASIKGQDKNGKYLLPLEFKTGREYFSHHAQSSLYSLLFKDRYDLDVNSFLLVYTKEKMMKIGNIRSADLRSLINLRNRISEYLLEGVRKLPEVIKTTSICQRCDVQAACMTLHLLVEDGTSETSGLPEVFQGISLTLQNQVYKDFYAYWDLLITKEEKLLKSMKKELWTMTSKERELQNGKALSNLVISEIKETNESPYKFQYSFERSPSSDINQSFQATQLTTHSRIMISDERGHFALANGFITSIRPDKIIVAVDRRVVNSSVRSKDYNNANNQVFESVLTTNSKLNEINHSNTYRLDKDDMFHGMGLARFNLLNLFMPEGDSLRRQQIIDLVPPKFNDEDVDIPFDSHFNPDQTNAFRKIATCEDYALILGMPGTGKTTLIASVINYLVQQGKSILLASYTHSAVDNILLKVKKYDIDILRIGHPSRVRRDIQQYVPKEENINSFEDYQSFYLRPSVVGVTCLGINDYAFNIRTQFDYCIIDEASQVSLPVSLGPLRLAEKFVLVGDHHQLPPLVQHSHPKVKSGLLRSLFQYLNDEFPNSVSELTYQYRMCDDIMQLSNEIVYDGRLKCGTEEVANQVLKLPHPDNYKVLITGERDSWMQWIVKEQNRVIFLDHDLVPGVEVNHGERIQNPTEALLIWQIVEALTLCGVNEQDIGIMSLYRAQLSMLTKQFLNKPNIECMTADQFQGRDKDCVIISLVRSNDDGKVGDLLQEWRRINVAVTRSKSKLIILGSKKTLSNSPVLKKFIDLVMEKKWMYRLPPKATSFYKSYDSYTAEGVHKTMGSSRSNSQVKPLTSSRAVKNSPIINDIINDIK